MIDVNLRFEKLEKEYNDRTRIILVDIDDLQAGLIVDGVDEVLDIANNRVSSPPSFSSDTSLRYVTGIASLDKYMVLMLWCSRVALGNGNRATGAGFQAGLIVCLKLMYRQIAALC